MLSPKEKLAGLDPSFVTILESLNKALGPKTYTITSAKRAPEANAAVGGVKDSAHTRGLALDVAHDRDLIKAMRLAYWLGRLNVIRVGFYDGHVHFDIDKSLPQTQWEGKSK